MFEFTSESMLLSAFSDMLDEMGITWSSILLHLIALVILTVGLYLLLFKPVKKMIRERQEKVKKIEKENAELNEEVKALKNSSEKVLADAKKEAAAIHESVVKVANQKASDIVGEAKAKAKAMIDRTETEMGEERKKLQADVEKQIADVSLVVAEKVIGRDISIINIFCMCNTLETPGCETVRQFERYMHIARIIRHKMRVEKGCF